MIGIESDQLMHITRSQSSHNYPSALLTEEHNTWHKKRESQSKNVTKHHKPCIILIARIYSIHELSTESRFKSADHHNVTSLSECLTQENAATIAIHRRSNNSRRQHMDSIQTILFYLKLCQTSRQLLHFLKKYIKKQKCDAIKCIVIH